MKAERQKTEFNPIIITLESEEEAEFLYYLLFCKEEDLQNAIDERQGFGNSANYIIPQWLDNKMFVELNKVYTPKDR